jgi:ABC-type sugar transport system ATPase subunit
MNLFERDGSILGIRPECIRAASDGMLGGRVVRRESTGADAYLEVQTERGSLAVRVPASHAARAGDSIGLDLPAESLRRFDPTTGRAAS